MPVWTARRGTSRPPPPRRAGPPAPFPPPPAAAPTAHLIGTRPRAQVEAIIANIDQAWAAYPDSKDTFAQAVRDTYEWALGRRPGPVTGRTSPVDDEALEREDDTANDLIYTRGSIPRDYAVGVQHAAMWLQGLTEDQPWVMYQL